MELFEAITTRKTIREYKNTHPPTEDIKKIIDAARLAPSAINAQNWEFIAIYNKDILDKMSDAVSKKYDELSALAEKDNNGQNPFCNRNFALFFNKAPVVIVVVEIPRVAAATDFLKSHNFSQYEIDQRRPDSSLLSLGGAIENMSLAAHALGYGTCWMCAPVIAAVEMKALLDIPEEHRIVTLLPVGVPDNADYSSRVPKKSLDEIMKIIQ